MGGGRELQTRNRGARGLDQGQGVRNESRAEVARGVSSGSRIVRRKANAALQSPVIRTPGKMPHSGPQPCGTRRADAYPSRCWPPAPNAPIGEIRVCNRPKLGFGSTPPDIQTVGEALFSTDYRAKRTFHPHSASSAPTRIHVFYRGCRVWLAPASCLAVGQGWKGVGSRVRWRSATVARGRIETHFLSRGKQQVFRCMSTVGVWLRCPREQMELASW